MRESSQIRDRSLELIAEFDRGFARGWFYAVGEFFRDELDIRYTPRVVDDRTVMCWTQGRCFGFREGHVLYDTPAAYQKWDEALKEIAYMCEIQKGAPSVPGRKRGTVVEGYVEFILLKPDAERTRLEPRGHYACTQTEFVEYLKTGNLAHVRKK